MAYHIVLMAQACFFNLVIKDYNTKCINQSDYDMKAYNQSQDNSFAPLDAFKLFDFFSNKLITIYCVTWVLIIWGYFHVEIEDGH